MSKIRRVGSYRSIRSRDRKSIFAEAVRLMETRISASTLKEVRKSLCRFAKKQHGLIIDDRIASQFLRDITPANAVKPGRADRAAESLRMERAAASARKPIMLPPVAVAIEMGRAWLSMKVESHFHWQPARDLAPRIVVFS